MRRTLMSLLIFATASVAETGEDRDVLYQVSTIDALLAGVYEGSSDISSAMRHGDFGLGTFDRLDGEMIVLDGKVYQAAYDGSVNAVPPDTGTPFMAVTWFEADVHIDVPSNVSYKAFEAWLENELPSRNMLYAIRVDGVFDTVSYRSVPRQNEKPFLPLAEVVRKQRVFQRDDIKGTLVGFWCPAYAKGINVPGFHLHFFSEDRMHAGHVLDFVLSSGEVVLDVTDGWEIQLPEDETFLRADLGADRSGALNAVEQGREHTGPGGGR